MKERQELPWFWGTAQPTAPNLTVIPGPSPWERVTGRLGGMNWRQMAGTKGQAVRTILWLMRTGNCWHEAPYCTMSRGSRWPQL